jgi:hypothetical protein
MDTYSEDNNYSDTRDLGTGSHCEFKEYKIKTYPFDKYEIKIKLTPNNEFIEVLEVKINKDFLSHKQKILSQGFHDVEKFYQE